MSSVSVLMPWAGVCPHRLSALAHVRSWYTENYPDWDICIGDAHEGADWCKAEAVRSALHWTRPDTDILVIADADCIAPNIGDAVDAIRSGNHGWAMPHRTVHRLNHIGTGLVVQQGADPAGLPRTLHYYTQMPYTGYAGGGIVVLKKNTYTECPLDPRFVGWGQEDESWAIALKSLFGPPWRPRHAPLWHLWHPPQQRTSRAVGSSASRSLRAEYRRLSKFPDAMKDHIRNAKSYVSCVKDEADSTSCTSQG